MPLLDQPNYSFDFAAHTQKFVEEYQKRRPDYEGYAGEIANLLEKALRARKIPYATIEKRAKGIESFRKKVSKQSREDLALPKYLNPLTDIEDLAGVRVITYFLETIEEVDEVIYELFDVREKLNKREKLEQTERFGYQSVHYIISFSQERLKFLELLNYAELKAEIQVRTILQHSWAEIEHDIQYTSVETIPATIRRRFAALAGLLEIADREFQAIQAEDRQLKALARQSVLENKLEGLEITPDAVKAYLDKLLGPDARVTDASYSFTASMLHHLGFEDFHEIDVRIVEYTRINLDKDLSTIAWRAKQGQIMKFETLLLASMGRSFISKHPRATVNDFGERYGKAVRRLRQAGIDVGKWEDSF